MAKQTKQERDEDKKIEALHRAHCQGMQISVMRIPDLFKMARTKLRAGESDDAVASAMVAFVTSDSL